MPPAPGSSPAQNIQRLPGMGGGTGVSSGQQGQMPWQSTGKPMDQELEAQRLLSGQPAQMPGAGGGMFGAGGGQPQLNAMAQQMPGGGGMFGAGGGGANAINEWMLNNAKQGAAGQMGGMFGGGTPMAKPGMQDMMARMLGSAPAAPMPAMPAPAAAMGEPTSFAKSGGGGGKGKVAVRGGGGQGRR